MRMQWNNSFIVKTLHWYQLNPQEWPKRPMLCVDGCVWSSYSTVLPNYTDYSVLALYLFGMSFFFLILAHIYTHWIWTHNKRDFFSFIFFPTFTGMTPHQHQPGVHAFQLQTLMSIESGDLLKMADELLVTRHVTNTPRMCSVTRVTAPLYYNLAREARLEAVLRFTFSK